MSAKASDVASSIATVIANVAGLEPTGIAKKILAIASALKEQYEQMEHNKESCEGLTREVGAISKIVVFLSNAKQADFCEDILKELEDCLAQCSKLITSISAKKDTFGKIKDFLSAGPNKSLIKKLTDQLHEISNLLNLALTVQTSQDVASFKERANGKITEIQIEKRDTHQEQEVDKFVSQMQAINAGRDVIIGDGNTQSNTVNKTVNYFSSTSERHSPKFSIGIRIRPEDILDQLRAMFLGRAYIREKSSNHDVYNDVLRNNVLLEGYDARLIHKKPLGKEKEKEGTYILYSRQNELTPEDAVTEIGSMIQSLKKGLLKTDSPQGVDFLEVLQELKDLFIKEEHKGSEFKDLKLYNRALGRYNVRVRLIYSNQIHTLYMNDEPLERKNAIKVIGDMIYSQEFSSDHSLQHPENPKDNSGKTILLSFNKKEGQTSVQKVNPEELGAFLKFVCEGEQRKAEAMLQINRDLVLGYGDLVDLSNKAFKKITAFQYALWALDWHMWTMLLKYLPPDAARSQAQEIETGSWVATFGLHANWQKLLDAQKTYIDNYKKWSRQQCNRHWIQVIGEQQLLLPAHVINEYCHPTRSFSPCPDFTKPEPDDIWRTRKIDEGEWFTANHNGGTLGIGFAVFRAGSTGRGMAGGAMAGVWFSPSSTIIDYPVVSKLFDIRQQQRANLLETLTSRHSLRDVK